MRLFLEPRFAWAVILVPLASLASLAHPCLSAAQLTSRDIDTGRSGGRGSQGRQRTIFMGAATRLNPRISNIAADQRFNPSYRPVVPRGTFVRENVADAGCRNGGISTEH
ncbi:hypothetical protein T484DRAFT_2764204 [Baffinella frigidus]|nr:hypothetical protein T484DRAFT_2764204 [Cryptophyta sp. CCMP2293]